MFLQGGTLLFLCLKVPSNINEFLEVFTWLMRIISIVCVMRNGKRVKKICVFLVPFYEITNMISATCYPTSNLYFLQVWTIQTHLLESLKDEDEVIRDMAERMLVKFDK